jgi:hypothetical protein
MSTMNVVNATEGLLNALAMGVAAGNRPQSYAGDSPRTIAAVRNLVRELRSTQAALQTERAARAALEDENEVLRHALEEVTAQLMRKRDRRAGN